MNSNAFFKRAIPVWLRGRALEMNVQAGFVLQFDVDGSDGSCHLHLTGSSLYRVSVNGRFAHYGPARAGHGCCRVDRIELAEYVNAGGNWLTIEAAGYNCNSFYTLNQPSFVQAELYVNGMARYATGERGDFTGFALPIRIRQAMRYSYQRTFSEVYALDHRDGLTDWLSRSPERGEPLARVEMSLNYLPREVPVPEYRTRTAAGLIGAGCSLPKDERPVYPERRYIHQVGGTISGYPLAEIAERPWETVQDYTFSLFDPSLPLSDLRCPVLLDAGQFALLDMGGNCTGFIQCELLAEEDSEVYFLFDEKLVDGGFDVASWESVNIVKYRLRADEEPYRLESFEAYGYRYIQCWVPSGRIKLISLGQREYAYPDAGNTTFSCSDEQLNAVYRAAVETYRQNTLDVFMDCPTRERAGWLCDSYFTAQSAQLFSGNAVAEKVMLENYVWAETFPHLPDGMLPMCYPADHAFGNFIPQWAMWYVIQLDGYIRRSGADIAPFKPICYGLVAYFRPFLNADGLLEKLEKWNFIEWSQANEWVQDVNYPTNMLYARMLNLIGGWYDDQELREQSAQIRDRILEQSFDGILFRDHALRLPDGSLQVQSHYSEVCQYYAIFFRTADLDDPKFEELRRLVFSSFGPRRKAEGVRPDIAYANPFIGQYLRMEILLEHRRYDQLLDEIKLYYYPMAERTGTLWEHDFPGGSLNHGFASFAGAAIVRCLLGIRSIDEKTREIAFDFRHVPGLSGSGSVGVAGGVVEVRRDCSEGGIPTIAYRVPDAYKAIFVGSPALEGVRVMPSK